MLELHGCRCLVVEHEDTDLDVIKVGMDLVARYVMLLFRTT